MIRRNIGCKLLLPRAMTLSTAASADPWRGGGRGYWRHGPRRGYRHYRGYGPNGWLADAEAQP